MSQRRTSPSPLDLADAWRELEPPARIAAHWHAAGMWLDAGLQYRAAAAAAFGLSRRHDEAAS